MGFIFIVLYILYVVTSVVLIKPRVPEEFRESLITVNEAGVIQATDGAQVNSKAKEDDANDSEEYLLNEL